VRHAGLPAAAAILVATLAATLVPALAGADWLVLEDGSRVETRGAWEVKGRQIVFHLTDGTLSSLKSDQVDLEASREATRAAEEAANRRPEPAPEPPPAADETPRRKWTNADIPRGSPPSAPGLATVNDDDDGDDGTASAGGEQDGGEQDGGEQDGGGATAGDAAAGQPGDVSVAAWDRRETPEGDGLEIYGTLRNDREGTVASGAGVTVSLYDRSGGLVAEVAAEVTPSTIPDGGSAEFVAAFPSVFDFGAVRFQATSVPIDVGAGEPGRSTGPSDV
jgi:hypothetical protein